MKTMFAAALLLLVSGTAWADELGQACINAAQPSADAFMECAFSRTLELVESDMDTGSIANDVHSKCATRADALREVLRGPVCKQTEEQVRAVMQDFLDTNRRQIAETVERERKK